MGEEPTFDVRNPVDGWKERLAPEDLVSLNGAHHLARYLFAAHFAAGRRVADLCCGTGYGTNLLLSAGAAEAHGIDLSPEAVEEAGRRFPEARFSVADATKPLELSADLRVCFEGIEHVPDPEGLVRNLRSGLPDEGIAVVSTPNGEGGQSANPHHLREFTRTEFRDLLSEHFGLVRMYFQWWYHDPLGAGWGLRDRAKAFAPRWLESLRRRKSSDALDGRSGGPTAALPFRPVPEAELKVTAARLRYGKPAFSIAVCQPRRT